MWCKERHFAACKIVDRCPRQQWHDRKVMNRTVLVHLYAVKILIGGCFHLAGFCCWASLQYWQANIGRPNTLRHFTPTFALPMCEIKDATGCRWIDLKSTRFWDGHSYDVVWHRGGQTEWSFGDPPPCDFAQKVEESMVSFSMFKQPVLLGTSNPVPWLHDQCFTFGFHWSSRSYLSSQCFSTVSCRHHERIRDFEGKHAKKCLQRQKGFTRKMSRIVALANEGDLKLCILTSNTVISCDIHVLAY